MTHQTEFDVEAYQTLGSPPRAQLLMALVEGPKRPSELLKYLENTLGMWFHIKQLVNAHFIVPQSVEARKTYYHLNPARLRALAIELNALADMTPDLPEGVEPVTDFQDAFEELDEIVEGTA